MPKKWRNHWKFSGNKTEAEFRDKKLLTIGNLAIITQPLNSSIRDADWATKKTGIGKNGGLQKYSEGFEILSQFLNLDEWDEKAIKDRADFLAKKALETWSI